MDKSICNVAKKVHVENNFTSQPMFIIKCNDLYVEMDNDENGKINDIHFDLKIKNVHETVSCNCLCLLHLSVPAKCRRLRQR